MAKKIGKYGKKVIGAEQREKERVFIKDGRRKYGPRLLGDRPALPGNQPDPARNKIVPGVDLSVEKLREVLKRNPHFVTAMYEKEIDRPRGARVDALKAIKAAIPPRAVQGPRLTKQIDEMLARAGKAALVFPADRAREMERTKAVRKKLLARRKQNLRKAAAAGLDTSEIEESVVKLEESEAAEEELTEPQLANTGIARDDDDLDSLELED